MLRGIDILYIIIIIERHKYNDMNTQQKNHLLIKEMVGHIVSKKPHIVILDMDDYHTIMNSISQEDQATFQDHEVTVSKFF